MHSRLIQMAREPLLQFLLIGASIYGAYALIGTPDNRAADSTIVVDATRIENFAGQWRARWNRPPTQAELDGIINAFIREDILARQAIAMGLGEDDPITRRRLAQKLEFLTSDLALLKTPAEGELETFFEERSDTYREPDLITFSQIFLDPDKRDEETLDDATVLLTQLQDAGTPDPAELDEGDTVLQQGYFESATEAQVRRELGSGFAETVMSLQPGKWHGPVLSGFGVHLVYIYEFKEAPAPVFEDVKGTVLADWQTVQQEAFNEAYLAGLMERYDVVIEDIPDNLVLKVAEAPEDLDAAVEPAS